MKGFYLVILFHIVFWTGIFFFREQMKKALPTAKRIAVILILAAIGTFVSFYFASAGSVKLF